MFRMEKVGIRISELRRKKNMTQMELADKMCISYQAVSNWERGISMPDISKLPELAALFDTTIDDLLGEHAPLVENAAADTLAKYLEEHPVTVDELCEAAPILKPTQVTATFEKVKEQSKSEGSIPDIDKITSLLPFLDAKARNELAIKLADKKAYKELTGFARFINKQVLHDIALKMESERADITPLRPFLDKETINEVARKRVDEGRSLKGIAMNVSKPVLSELALKMEEKGQNVNDIRLFLDKETLKKIVLLRLGNE